MKLVFREHTRGWVVYPVEEEGGVTYWVYNGGFPRLAHGTKVYGNWLPIGTINEDGSVNSDNLPQPVDFYQEVRDDRIRLGCFREEDGRPLFHDGNSPNSHDQYVLIERDSNGCKTVGAILWPTNVFVPIDSVYRNWDIRVYCARADSPWKSPVVLDEKGDPVPDGTTLFGIDDLEYTVVNGNIVKVSDTWLEFSCVWVSILAYVFGVLSHMLWQSVAS